MALRLPLWGNSTISNFVHSGTAEVWQLTASNAINRLSDALFTGNSLSNTLPAQSITLFVVSVGIAASPLLRADSLSPSNTFDSWLDGQAGQYYAIQASGDRVTWVALQTNLLVRNSLRVALPATNEFRFYRAQLLP